MDNHQNILLVNSYCKFKFIPPLYPIALAYIGSYALARTKANISVLDLNLYDKPWDKLKETLKEKKPDIVGVSMRDMPWYPSLFSSPVCYISKLCQIVKSHDRDIKLIAGGACFSLFANDLMGLLPDIDIGIVGEGEEPFKEIITDIKDFRSIKGICYREGSSLRYTGKRPFMNADDIPILQDIPGLVPSKYSCVGVQTRRGCAFECVYCPNDFLQGRCIRRRPVKKIIEEIKFYKNRGVNNIYFADTIFNVPKDFAKEIVEEIIRNKINIKWGVQFKPIDIDESFLKMVEVAGCNIIDLTADSGSDETLKLIKTNVLVKDILESAALISKFKTITQTWCGITNLPGETVKTNLDRIKLILKLIKNGVRPGNIFLNRLKYCPYTELNELYPVMKKIDINKPSFYYWYRLFDKDIYMTFLVGLFAIYRALKGFKRYAY